MRKIKVVSCPYPEWWFNKHVGQEIWIKDEERKNDFVVLDRYTRKENGELDNGGTIPKEYCELLSNSYEEESQ